MHIGELSDLARLRSVLSEREAVSVEAVDTLGLLMASDLAPSTYQQTPRNCIPFAYTGGDGVHFSFADIGEGLTNASPIVMTVPMQFERPNLVVGCNLRDFLALGLRVGYFVLEGLQYNREKWVRLLEDTSYRPVTNAMELGTIKAIERAFDIAPWTNPEQHLHELEEQFTHLMVSGTQS